MGRGIRQRMVWNCKTKHWKSNLFEVENFYTSTSVILFFYESCHNLDISNSACNSWLDHCSGISLISQTCPSVGNGRIFPLDIRCTRTCKVWRHGTTAKENIRSKQGNVVANKKNITWITSWYFNQSSGNGDLILQIRHTFDMPIT